MHTVYILQNSLSNRYYIGSTSELNRRFDEHNRGQTRSTRYAKNSWKIIYTEQYNTKIEAYIREKVIKSYKGGNEFKKIIAGLVHR